MARARSREEALLLILGARIQSRRGLIDKRCEFSVAGGTGGPRCGRFDQSDTVTLWRAGKLRAVSDRHGPRQAK